MVDVSRKSSESLDLTGMVFGQWRVVSLEPSTTNPKKWMCRCSCGAQRSVNGSNLQRGASVSCGCAISPNRIGETHGRLTVIGRDGKNGSGEKLWRCRCACGKELSVAGSRLKGMKSCRCAAVIDIAGRRYGRLVCLNSQGTDKHGKALWLVRCDCGTEKTVSSNCLRRGSTVSCGCYRKERAPYSKRTHGLSRTPTYMIWKGITKRCSNAMASNYQYYGGRGIRVCERWASYENFLADMGELPSKQHSIDRVDSDGDYSPDNCRWLLLSKQNRNKRNNRLITHAGETLTLAEWAERSGLEYMLLFSRLARGWDMSRALQVNGPAV